MGLACRIRGEVNRALRREIEGWQRDHLEAMAARDIEDCVQFLLSMRAPDKELLDRIAQDASAQGAGSYTDAFNAVQTLCDAVTALFRKIKPYVRQAQANGHIIEGAEQMESALTDYARWKDDFYDFLLLSEPRVEKSLKKRMEGANSKTRRRPPASRLKKH